MPTGNLLVALKGHVNTNADTFEHYFCVKPLGPCLHAQYSVLTSITNVFLGTFSDSFGIHLVFLLYY